MGGVGSGTAPTRARTPSRLSRCCGVVRQSAAGARPLIMVCWGAPWAGKPVHLVLDGLPAHKTTMVETYVASTKGVLTLHFLPGYAHKLNPDELVWSHIETHRG